jgi:hypothetical protein
MLNETAIIAKHGGSKSAPVRHGSALRNHSTGGFSDCTTDDEIPARRGCWRPPRPSSASSLAGLRLRGRGNKGRPVPARWRRRRDSRPLSCRRVRVRGSSVILRPCGATGWRRDTAASIGTKSRCPTAGPFATPIVIRTPPLRLDLRPKRIKRLTHFVPDAPKSSPRSAGGGVTGNTGPLARADAQCERQRLTLGEGTFPDEWCCVATRQTLRRRT